MCAVQDAAAIPALVPCLALQQPLSVQLSALRGLDNLCKISATRQEAAAMAGIVPSLVSLMQLASEQSSPTGVCPQTKRPGGAPDRLVLV